jgi:uncharacterized protein (UPF0371 family)
MSTTQPSPMNRDEEIARLTQALKNAAELSRNREDFCMTKVREVERLTDLLKSLDLQIARGQLTQAREDIRGALKAMRTSPPKAGGMNVI